MRVTELIQALQAEADRCYLAGIQEPEAQVIIGSRIYDVTGTDIDFWQGFVIQAEEIS